MSDPLPRLLSWYREAWAAEVPTVLHTRGVEWDRTSGGSLLGTPRWAHLFTDYLSGSAYAVEYARHDGVNQADPNYVRPLRCALAWMAHHGAPFESRWLWDLGAVDGDWLRVGRLRELVTMRAGGREERAPFPASVAEMITREALMACRRVYVRMPLERREGVA